jgi:RNA polymerase sigma factor (sigma-70 family)
MGGVEYGGVAGGVTDFGMGDARDAEDRRLLAAGEHARLLASWAPRVMAICRTRCRDRGDAEELASRVLERLCRELKQGKDYGDVPFSAVVHNVVRWEAGGLFAERRKDPTPVADPEPGRYEEPLAEVEGRLSMEAAFAELPARDREVMRMRWIEQVSPDQIAERLGITRNAVDQATHRGVERLRESWC